MNTVYERFLAVLSRYLSRVNAQLMLDRAIKRTILSPERLAASDIDALLPHLERSAQLFVERRRLPELLAELRGDSASAPSSSTIPIKDEEDVSRARVAARDMCEAMGASSLHVRKVATLVSELARNIVEYTPGGRIELVPLLEPRKQILVRASDSGRGIPNLEEIMSGGYKSKTGLGMGIRGSKRLADRFQIDTGRTGTRIEAEVHL